MENKTEILLDFINEELSEVPNSLNYILESNNEKYNTRSEFITIKNYIDKYLENHDSTRFIVLPGLRGVGKTTLLYQTYEYLLKEKNIIPEHILYISCDDLKNLIDTNLREVIETYLKKRLNTTLRTLNEEIFLLVDESHFDNKWALTGKVLYDKNKHIFMIFTGSSALNLEYNADAARRMHKQYITPLNYTEHIRLKYNHELPNITPSLLKLIFESKVDEAREYESKTNSQLINLNKYTTNDWNNYLMYGSFPMFNKDSHEISEYLLHTISKIINTDMMSIKNMNFENQSNANRILRFLATQESMDVSQNKISNHLKTSSANVKQIIDLLEKTQLIFHYEAYGTSSKRMRKSWKYYFATSSLKHILSKSIGKTNNNLTQHEGILIENMVASTLFNLKHKFNHDFYVYYDSNKVNVDFIIDNGQGILIPVEVGRGKKDKKQVVTAMDAYDCDHGIIISNKTDSIQKDDDVIYIPPKTFSLL